MTYDEYHHDDQKLPIAIPLAELKTMAAAVAEEMKTAPALSPELRERFINVRAALFQRGIYDPVLVRFDSATAPQASPSEVADQLASVAASLA
jgi:hypothetical protein